MITYTDLKPGTEIIVDDEPYVVLEYTFAKKQRQKPTVQTKIKNLINSKVVERAFHQNDKIESADMETKEVKFLYANKSEFWFCQPDNPRERFKLGENLIGSSAEFLKENFLVKASIFKSKIININLPAKIDLKVIEAPPAVRGNTAQGVTKQVKLETGTFLIVPIFINTGDTIRINTETGRYVERVNKV